MKTMKPREIFNLLEDDGWSVTVPMPRGPFGLEVGQGLTLLETFLLIAIARIVNAEYIFEFGTHHGATARAEFLEDRAIRIESTMLAVEGLKIP